MLSANVNKIPKILNKIFKIVNNDWNTFAFKRTLCLPTTLCVL